MAAGQPETLRSNKNSRPARERHILHEQDPSKQPKKNQSKCVKTRKPGRSPQQPPGPQARGRRATGRGRRALSPSTIAALPRPRGAAAVLTHPRAARRGPRLARHGPRPARLHPVNSALLANSEVAPETAVPCVEPLVERATAPPTRRTQRCAPRRRRSRRRASARSCGRRWRRPLGRSRACWASLFPVRTSRSRAPTPGPRVKSTPSRRPAGKPGR